MSSPPIVFIHTGTAGAWFLDFSLQQARHASPGSKVFLLGDRASGPGVEFRRIDRSNKRVERFSKAYKHLSGNPYGYELFCFTRWFHLLDLMVREGFTDSCYFDSDVLLYGSTEVLQTRVRETHKSCGFIIPGYDHSGPPWACGHASYWTRDALECFCNSALELFENADRLAAVEAMITQCRAAGPSGGLCDMTALHYFAEEHPGLVHNLAERWSGGTVDNNISESANLLRGEYQMSNSIKQIDFIDGMPQLLARDGQQVAAHALHFQGPRKKLMPRFYTGGPFPGKRRAEARLALRAAPKKFRNWLLRKEG